MNTRVPLTDADGEVRELTADDLRHFQPMSALPKSLQAKLRGRPKADSTKAPVKIRLDADILVALRDSGAGWQTRINDTLRAALQLTGRL